MRARVLVLLSTVAIGVPTAAFSVALAQTGANAAAPERIAVDVSRMQPGDVTTIPVSLDVLGGARWPVFVADEGAGRIAAFVGRAQGVPCPLVAAAEPDYARMTDLVTDAFEDPCGGALFAIDGTCMDGPCTHSLDQLRVTVRRGVATVDLDTIIPGRSGRRFVYAAAAGSGRVVGRQAVAGCARPVARQRCRAWRDHGGGRGSA